MTLGLCMVSNAVQAIKENALKRVCIPRAPINQPPRAGVQISAR